MLPQYPTAAPKACETGDGSRLCFKWGIRGSAALTVFFAANDCTKIEQQFFSIFGRENPHDQAVLTRFAPPASTVRPVLGRIWTAVS
jgi:hypothetical protein